MRKLFSIAMLLALRILPCFAQEFSSNIPVVDMNDFYNEETRQQFVTDVHNALTTVGFFAVINPGVNQEYIDNAFAKAEEFFNLDFETKLKYERPEIARQRGFIYTEKAKNAPVKDHKEFLHIGLDFTEEQAERMNSFLNEWPTEVDIEDTMKLYHAHLDEFRIKMQHVIALALGEEEDFFDEMNKEGESLLRVAYYPPMEQSHDERAIWAEAHVDLGLFTILPRATAKGLEVQLDDGSWMPIEVEGDAFIVNTGNFLEIFSNGYFKGAMHRVRAPENNHNKARYSMVYFVHPHADALLYPLPQWVEATGGKPLFAQATRYEMLAERHADHRIANDEMLEWLGKCGVMERLIELDRASVDAMQYLKEKGYASEVVLQKLKELEME